MCRERENNEINTLLLTTPPKPCLARRRQLNDDSSFITDMRGSCKYCIFTSCRPIWRHRRELLCRSAILHFAKDWKSPQLSCIHALIRLHFRFLYKIMAARKVKNDFRYHRHMWIKFDIDSRPFSKVFLCLFCFLIFEH